MRAITNPAGPELTAAIGRWAELIEAELKGNVAQMTVKFVSELISATRSATGDVIAGDPKRIKEVTDIWTFARDVTSGNPNWRLVATQAAS